ncbi:hypothetical protein ACIRQF_07400 [Streptomyces sp. NPDC101191]|uniref:hypothetical protein n=1 Tax=Streptomyces sp. NPDC101191 TaxID=3366126 RepID=UPI00380EEEEE
MSEGDRHEASTRTFLACAAEVARPLDLEAAADVPEDRRARHLAGAARRTLLERATLPEKFFDPLMAAAVYDPDPSFCRWFVEPALYAFGRRRVMTALLGYLRTGTAAHLPLRADRSPAYAPSGSRDPALDGVDDVVDQWRKSSSTQQRDHRASASPDQA